MSSISAPVRNGLWIALLTTATVLTTLAFNCATPFAALGAVAGAHMARRDALLLMGVVWFANQFVGFAFLGYPQDASTIIWGVALLATAVVGMEAARIAAKATFRFGAVAFNAAALVAAFVAGECVVAAAGVFLPGGDVSLAVQESLFILNAVTFVALLAAHRAAIAVGLVARSRPAHALA